MKTIIIILLLASPAYAFEMPWQGKNETWVTKDAKADHVIAMGLCSFFVAKWLDGAKVSNVFTRNPKTAAAMICILPMIYKEEKMDATQPPYDHIANIGGVVLGLTIYQW